MNIRPSTEHDLPTVRRLLEDEKLPVDIIDERKGELWVGEKDGRVIGSGALEICGEDALLRSVVVSPDLKGTGIGSRIVNALEQESRTRGIQTIWLLTETAEHFFARRGYEKVDRSVVLNKQILDTSEFRHLCASTAVCMRKHLESKTVNRKP